MSIKYYVSNFFKRHGGTILTALSSIGVVGTAYLSGKATVEAKEELKTLGEDAPLKEKAKAVLPIYIPTLATGAATLLCMWGANGLNRKQQVSMLAAGALLEQTYNKYKDKADELLGENVVDAHLAKDDISRRESDMTSEDRLFYYNYYQNGEHPEYGSYFQCSVDRVLKAEMEVNRQFILGRQVTLNYFFDLLGLDPVEGGDNVGWSTDIGAEFYGYSWIDFEHYDATEEDGLEVTIISTPFQPSMLA